MSNRTRNITGVLAASLVLLSASADAQGKSKEKNKEHKDKSKVERVSNGDYERNRERERVLSPERRRELEILRARELELRRERERAREIARARERERDRDRDGRDDDDRDRNRDWDRNGNGIRDENERKIPPGLAKKPGQMPPGQYKKRYETSYGATTLSDILRSRGYTVDRVTPYGTSQYVYYRTSDGAVRRAVVSQGSERLTFTNVPADLVRLVLARLY